MSQSKRKPKPSRKCRDCGATNDPDASECWLCGRRDWRAVSSSPATKPDTETFDRAMWMSSVETLLIALALAVVALGVARQAPGLGIALLILLVPAWAITEWNARSQSQPMSAPRKFVWIVGLTVLMPVLLVVTLLIGVFASCTALFTL
jgi:hypothetical protein